MAKETLVGESGQSNQHYVLFVRAVYGGNTVMQNGAIHIQNAGEAQAYLNDTYLSQGYRILSVDYLGEVLINEGDPNSQKAMRFAYHLAKGY